MKSFISKYDIPLFSVFSKSIRDYHETCRVIRDYIWQSSVVKQIAQNSGILAMYGGSVDVFNMMFMLLCSLCFLLLHILIIFLYIIEIYTFLCAECLLASQTMMIMMIMMMTMIIIILIYLIRSFLFHSSSIIVLHLPVYCVSSRVRKAK